MSILVVPRAGVPRALRLRRGTGARSCHGIPSVASGETLLEDPQVDPDHGLGVKWR
jgi:hypothetical protein